ncbi:MAG: RNA-binding protein [Methanobacterium sp. BRmetb2]|nr:MAG: RNA-binding protein [Methanobacterium sp. BRmetb2]
MKIRKRYYLKKKKLKELQKKLGEYAKLIPAKSKVEEIETDIYQFILVDGEPLIIMLEGEPLPTLKAALKLDIIQDYAVVDMGAVKFMTKGADVMSPGIVDADKNLKEGDIVFVVDEQHKKPLAIGRCLISGEEMIENDKGKAIKTIHYIGDKIWDFKV